MVLYYLINRKKRLFFTIIAVLSAILLNGILSYINDIAGLPIFMDSMFTILTAALFGLWPSIAVGLLTNIFIELLNGFPGIYMAFTPVNILTALTTSFFIYRKLFETPAHALWLIIILAIINSLTGALIVSFFFGGFTNLSLDNIVRAIMVTGHSLISSAFVVRLVVNLVDKGPAVMLSYYIYKSIQRIAEKRV